MLILRLSFLNGVAIAASLTVVLTVAASVTLLPALLSFIGMRALSRRERRRLAEHGPAARAAHRLRRPLVRVRRAPPQAARRRRRRRSCWCSPCPPSRSTSAPPTRATTRPPPPPARPTTCSPRASAPASTARSPWSPASTAPTTGSPSTSCRRPCAATEGVASVGPVDVQRAAATPACLTVVPDSSPQSARPPATSSTGCARTSCPRAEAGTSLDVHVGGVTAGYDDFAEVIVGKLPLFVGVVIGLGCLLLLLGLPLHRHPAQGRGDERRRRRLVLRRRRRDLPVGLGQRTAGPRQRRARSSPSCRSSWSRSSSGSPWTTRSSWSAGCTRSGWRPATTGGPSASASPRPAG